MARRSWQDWLRFSRSAGHAGQQKSERNGRPSYHRSLHIEALEDRRMLSVTTGLASHAFGSPDMRKWLIE